MLYFAKLVVFVPVDSAADPEQANLCRILFEPAFHVSPCRAIECHFPAALNDAGLRMARNSFRDAFPSDESGYPKRSLIAGLVSHRFAARLVGMELQVRNCQPTESIWTVIESWRK